MLRAQDDVVALLIRFKTSQAVRRTAAPYRRRLIHSFGGVGTRSSLAMPSAAARALTVRIRGTVSPVSIRAIVARLTPAAAASSSCVMSFCARRSLVRSASCCKRLGLDSMRALVTDPE
jgi:hypothetical protein